MTTPQATTALSVNVNKIATLRNARGGQFPSVLRAAQTCIDAGCYGITVHPRPDERHIRTHDVFELAEMLRPQPGIEFNIEGYPSDRYMHLVQETRPHQATLVPDPPDVLTSNAGWDLRRHALDGDLAKRIKVLKELGARVSLFIYPDPEQIKLARAIGADRVELYTGPYADAFGTQEQDARFAPYLEAARTATSLGLGLNAGHDLRQDNLPFFSRNIPGLQEVSIGHAIVCDALYLGLHETVLKFLEILTQNPCVEDISVPQTP